MTLISTLDKARKDLETTITTSTPLYAVVGAGDLAVEKIRDAGAELTTRASKLDPKALRDQTQTSVATRVEAVQSDVRAAPEQVKALPAKAQAVFGDYVTTATSTYDALSGRGKSLVTRIRKQQATEDLQQQAKATTSKAKATTTTARKSAASAGSTAKRQASTTASTAKKSAAATKRSTKATGTSAKRTAGTAAKATKSGATKVGK
ncbi:MAG: hypothetical protein ACRDQA_14710 [Nocardioidaceae bacterium]